MVEEPKTMKKNSTPQQHKTTTTTNRAAATAKMTTTTSGDGHDEDDGSDPTTASVETAKTILHSESNGDGDNGERKKKTRTKEAAADDAADVADSTTRVLDAIVATPPPAAIMENPKRGSNKTTTKKKKKKYAYVFVADRETRLATDSGFVLNVLVSVAHLKRTAEAAATEAAAQEPPQATKPAIDFVLMIPQDAVWETEDAINRNRDEQQQQMAVESWLDRMGIYLRPYETAAADHMKQSKDDGDDVVDPALDKLVAVWSLTDYTTVVYLDAHRVVPIDSLDYWFSLVANATSQHQSPQQQQQEQSQTVLLASREQPAFTGFFVVHQPSEQDVPRLRQLIAAAAQPPPQEQQATDATTTTTTEANNQRTTDAATTSLWNVKTGWGVPLEEPWTTRYPNNPLYQQRPKDSNAHEYSMTWTFPGAASDAGLLYHFARYEKQSVTIVYGREATIWTKQDSPDGATVRSTTLQRSELMGHHTTINNTTDIVSSRLACKEWICQIYTYHGVSQPWTKPAAGGLSLFHKISRDLVWHAWWLQLQQLDRKLGMGLFPDAATNGQQPWRSYPATKKPKAMFYESRLLVADHATQQRHSRYAYAFVVGGCDAHTQAYKGYVYNILIAARLLKQRLNSNQDIVALVQMKHDVEADELPYADGRLLHVMGVRVYYMHKSPTESFYESVLNKFRILALTQYKRIILMDADAIPVRNMDWMFELSDTSSDDDDDHVTSKKKKKSIAEDSSKPRPRIKENLIVAGRQEPANAGFFMLAPKPGDYQAILEIQRQRASQESVQSWIWSPSTDDDEERLSIDPIHGWGHVIQPPDRWTTRSAGKFGTNWTFHFAYSDQGLLYHWTKYVKKSVSIVFKDYVENWEANPGGGDVTLQDVLRKSFFDVSKKGPLNSKLPCAKYMCDFNHFSGKGKPWLIHPLPEFLVPIAPNETTKNAFHLWWSTLYGLDEEFHMGLNFTHWPLNGTRPDQGFWASRRDVLLHSTQFIAREV